MSELWLLTVLALSLVSLLLVTVVALALYSGLLTRVRVSAGASPVRALTLAYKYSRGPYRQVGSLFTQSTSIGPELSCVGVYYDDPNQVPPEKQRCIIGSILSEGDEKPSEELVKLYEQFGFKIFSFPEVTHVVMTTFPFTTFLSLYLAMYKVYPVMNDYIKNRKLCAHPWLEIYRGDVIYYVCPLARQGDFYVPELKQAERKAKEEEGDGQTDITGADSFSDNSSVSYTDRSESRETSMAPSVAPFLSKRESEDSDSKSDRSESMASGSSFEELDLEGHDDGERLGLSQQNSELRKEQDHPAGPKKPSDISTEEEQ
eukprot:gi/632946729/ref/XP_007888702.1/ PREDICTED: testis-expressed sequence 264 protein [Callorhinchus milii]